ncbi:hypothetical protein H0H81_003223 [Sphagnurus paluster]|uniref:S-adenosyl-L-methionine-dependent methyltransferase n=1 Tax=Sphagnurus paluster TaxID=117069 RepID=A0A9P7GPG6_9AGAR|nr:hypothetical protein H0H81_003223 [Sphagnurus paluster]
MASKQLLAILATSLGPAQAALEFKWIQQHAANPSQLNQMVTRRSRGSQPFGPLNLLTRPPVLIPRPETEDWVIRLADHLKSSANHRPTMSLLDLGTGTGCIPLLLCHLLPQGSLNAQGVDISTHALQLATDNALLCGIPPSSPHRNTPQNTFTATLGSFLSPSFPDGAKITPPYDIITSNPPYIPWDEYLQLPRSVTAYEDPKALFGGPSGLDFYHAIARLIRRRDFLNPGAIVALEVGRGQAPAVERIMRVDAHMRDTEIWSDPWGIQRTVLAHL